MRTSPLRLNVLANVLGSAWLAVVQFIVVPVYLRLLGIEGYALIGFFLTLQGALRILDFGLGSTVNRELARYSVDRDRISEARDFFRTFEVFYWLTALAIAILLWLIAPLIVDRWLQERSYAREVVLHAVRSMGLLAAAQWPLSLYQSGLLGLERQPLLNWIRASMATAMAALGVLVLVFVARDIVMFFWSQVVAAAAHVLWIRVALWRSLPGPDRPHVRPGLFLNVYRFALGISGITVCSLVLTQADKIVLSRVLSLENFGYYSLASVAASALAAMNAPVFNAIFPRLTALVEQQRQATLRPLFRLASQCVAVVSIPSVIVIALFAPEIVRLWTGDALTTQNVAPVLAVLIVGTGLNTLMNLPYALQLAHGWTRLAFRLNFVFAAAIVPAVLIAVSRYGAVGAAFVWVVINLFYVLIGVPATHRRLFGDHGWYWFADLGRIVLAAVAVVGVWRLIYFVDVSTPVTLVVVAAAATTGTIAAAAVSTRVRDWTVAYVSGRRSRLA